MSRKGKIIFGLIAICLASLSSAVGLWLVAASSYYKKRQGLL